MEGSLCQRSGREGHLRTLERGQRERPSDLALWEAPGGIRPAERGRMAGL